MSLPAVILVGGQGTRLRPLTDRTRKDMLPIVDRPLLAYTFEHLARHGVEHAVISCGYLPDQIEAGFGTHHDGLSLEYAVEDEPLGTGGADPLRRPRARRAASSRSTATRCARPTSATLVAFHRSTGAKATILLTPVADPTRYGLVRTAADGRVETLPREAAARGDRHRPDQRRRLRARARGAGPRPAGPLRLDRARGLPAARRARAPCYGLALPGYWLDVGHAGVLPPGAPRRARAHLPDRGRRCRSAPTSRSSTRLRTFIPVAQARPARLRRPGRSGRGGCASRQPRRARSGCDARSAAVSSRTPSSAPARKSAPAASVVGSIVGEDAELGADCELHGLAVVGPGARVGKRANSLDSRPPRRTPASAFPDEALALLVSRLLGRRHARSTSRGATS